MINLALVEDEAFYRNGLKAFFEKSEDYQLIMAVDSAEKFLKYYNESMDIDILLLDVQLPGASGLDLAKTMNRRAPDIEMVMLTIESDEETIFNALTVGVNHYLLKLSSFEEIDEKLKSIQGGCAALDPRVAKKIVQYFSPKKNVTADHNLVKKELQIVLFIVDGLSYNDIAKKMGMTVDGIRYYIKRIYKKLQVNSRSEVIQQYLKGNLID